MRCAKDFSVSLGAGAGAGRAYARAVLLAANMRATMLPSLMVAGGIDISLEPLLWQAVKAKRSGTSLRRRMRSRGGGAV